jgi:transcriptional regulator with XRE-family HTH domain
MENEAFKRALGQILVRVRTTRNISQEKVALEAEVDRTRLGEIERGEANPTIDTLNRIARTLGQTLGSLIVEAEEISSGVLKKPIPKIDPKHINKKVGLPGGLTHEQLEQALNRAMVTLDQIGLDPTRGDIQMNIYSGAVSNIVTKAIAEVSDFVQNKDTNHPDLYNPHLHQNHPDWGLEMKATHQIAKGGESHNPGKGWFMVVIYQSIDGQTRIVQVEIAYLIKEEWKIHDRAEHSSRTRTAITLPAATKKLRENSVYLDPQYANAVLKKIREEQSQYSPFEES